MKQTTTKIIQHFPALKHHLNVTHTSIEGTMIVDPSDMNTIEKTFLELALFFENPTTQGFDIKKLYDNLDNEWLELALELIHLFFAKDTYLINKKNHSYTTQERSLYS